MSAGNQLTRCPTCLAYVYDGGTHSCNGYFVPGSPPMIVPGSPPMIVPGSPPMIVPTGWKCPQCQQIHAPAVLSCARCAPLTSGTLTGGTPWQAS